MRRAAWMLFVLASLFACRRVPASRGSIVFASVPDGVAADVFLATQAELMRSPRGVSEAIEQTRRGPSRKADDTEIEAMRRRIVVEQRAKTLILDVKVAGPDLGEAMSVCNALVDAFLRERAASRLDPIYRKRVGLQQSLERLDGGAGSEALQRELADLEAQRRGFESDARVLERCALPASR